ncbi:MAG TPA: GMC family oxidoreductase N-terminal domain-containing protein [Roseiarcus sp.]|nr:GMC family oxidoreductase N-terminal domain-containing protein [Roseiarcus sp.]
MHDYVVVGAGSAGCAIAARLSELEDASVLLLEAGPPDVNPYIHVPVGFYKMTAGPLTWGYRTTPQKGANQRRMAYAQGRVLGGGSSINAMVYTRGNPGDYDAWAAHAGCLGWAYPDLLPYFRKAEDNQRFHNQFHGTGGPLGVSDQISPNPLALVFLQAAQQFGIPYNPDFNSDRQSGCGLYQVTQRNGRRSSAAVGYLGPAKGRPNLTIHTNCLATRLIIENNRAVGVEYVRGKSRERMVVHAATEIIVASGAIGSPKLLMLSGIGRSQDLKGLGIPVHQDLQGVGQNLQDHVDPYVICELTGPYSYDHYARPWNMAMAGLEYLLFKKGPATSNLAEGGAFWYADVTQAQPDMQFHFMLGAGLEAGVPPVPTGYGCTLNSCHARPRSRGEVRLSNSDPFEKPLVDPNFWADPYDFEMSKRGVKMAREVMSQPAFAKYVKQEHLPGSTKTSEADLEDHCRRYAKTDYHPVGTCKMGVDPMAVVDLDLRVYGVDGLRVADSSIMPLLISSNTNAATIMIAEKAADLIKGNRRSPLAAA